MNALSLFDNFFDDSLATPDFTWRRAACAPNVDVKENKDSYTLDMDLPGRTEKDVKIELDNNVLTISSHKEEAGKEKSDNKEAEAKDSWLIRERRISEFSRRFILPEDVDAGNVAASFKNGVLSITIPRKALPAPRRIAIEAA